MCVVLYVLYGVCECRCCVYVRYCISYCIFLCLCEVVLVGIVCLEADVCVWEGGVFLCVYEMVCVWWYVYRSIVGACCVWGCYMWERVLGVCGVLCVLCMWVRALYREVVCVCVCSACGGMGGCVEVASWDT